MYTDTYAYMYVIGVYYSVTVSNLDRIDPADGRGREWWHVKGSGRSERQGVDKGLGMWGEGEGLQRGRGGGGGEVEEKIWLGGRVEWVCLVARGWFTIPRSRQG